MFKQNTAESGSAKEEASSRWKSDAFINIWLPNEEGGRRKLGAIGLKLNSPKEADLIEYLREDPSRINALLADAEVDFQMADGSSSAGFALPKK